jgi:hypothetical protein
MKLEKARQSARNEERRPKSVIGFKVSDFAARFSLLAA